MNIQRHTVSSHTVHLQLLQRHTTTTTPTSPGAKPSNLHRNGGNQRQPLDDKQQQTPPTADRATNDNNKPHRRQAHRKKPQTPTVKGLRFIHFPVNIHRCGGGDSRAPLHRRRGCTGI
jgi:hypothetical protein